jgi:hypothetical protein
MSKEIAVGKAGAGCAHLPVVLALLCQCYRA